MRKNIYEILDEFDKAPDERSKALVFFNNDSQVLRNVLKLTFDERFQFYIKSMPEGYEFPDTVPGVSYGNLETELRRLYMFRIGDPTAEKLNPRRREELFINMCESLEPNEARVLLNIMNKDLKVKGLNLKFVRKFYPNL